MDDEVVMEDKFFMTLDAMTFNERLKKNIHNNRHDFF